MIFVKAQVAFHPIYWSFFLSKILKVLWPETRTQACLWESINSSMLNFDIRNENPQKIMLFYFMTSLSNITLCPDCMPSWLRNTRILIPQLQLLILKYTVAFSEKMGYFYNYWFQSVPTITGIILFVLAYFVIHDSFFGIYGKGKWNITWTSIQLKQLLLTILKFLSSKL